MQCKQCGDVEHQPIPEDEQHCGCRNGIMLGDDCWVSAAAVKVDPGRWCDCACHDGVMA